MDNTINFAHTVANAVAASLAPAPVTVLYANTTPGQIEEGVPDGGHLLHIYLGPTNLANGSANRNIYNQCKSSLVFRLFTRSTSDVGSYDALLERKVNMDTLYAAALVGIGTYIDAKDDYYIGIENSSCHLAEVNDYMVDGIICATYRVDVRFFV